jgi:hypothetical protein
MIAKKEQKNSVCGIIHSYRGNKKLGHKTNQDFMRTQFSPQNKITATERRNKKISTCKINHDYKGNKK